MDERQNGNLEEQEVNKKEVTREEEMTVHLDETTVEAGAAESPQVEQETSGEDEQPPGDDNTQEELNRLKQELDREKARAEEYYNRLLRVQADFDNFRKRTLKEKEEFWKYAPEPLITAILPVLDNFQRALQTPPGDGEKLLEGVKMIYRQLQEVLENEGLKLINSQGEEFDPNLHEAVMQEETTEYPDNTVIEELRTGYFFKDRLIRPAMVKVARSS